MINLTKNNAWISPSFVELKYNTGKKESGYAYTPSGDSSSLSFLFITPNTRDKNGCDFGIYRWIESRSYYCKKVRPVKFRFLNKKEENKLRLKLKTRILQ